MRSLLLGLSPWVFVACGGAISPVDPSSFQLEGSYDLSVATVTLTGTEPQQPMPPNTTHPAEGSHARIDIKKVNGAYEAAITVDFSDPIPATLTATNDGTITLIPGSSGASFSGSSNGYQYVIDELNVIRLHVGADGKLGGAWSASGSEMVNEGDVGWMNDMTSTGTIGADARPPQVTASALSTALAPSTLPWDPIYVRASEPVELTQLQGSSSLAGASGPLSVAWSSQQNQPGWIGATQLVGYRNEWSTKGQTTISVTAGILDPSGNASAAVSTPTTFLDVPLAAAFDATTVPAQWGPVAVVSGATACGTDGVSCVEIGPVTGPCQGQSSAGIAGRLSVPSGQKTLAMKYRVRAAGQYGQPYLMSPLGFSLATPGAPAQDAQSPLSPPFTAVTDVDYPWSTDWISVTEPLPANTGEVGFSFAPFDQRSSSYCGGGPMMPPVTLLVDVIAVTTAP